MTRIKIRSQGPKDQQVSKKEDDASSIHPPLVSKKEDDTSSIHPPHDEQPKVESPTVIKLRIRKSKNPSPNHSPKPQIQPVRTTLLVPGKPNSDKKQQLALNKKLEKAMINGRTEATKNYILDGGSLAYANYNGITTAAENGCINIFLLLFNEFDFTRIIDNYILNDCITIAKWENHTELITLLESYVGICPLNIINENIGFDKNEE